MRNGLLLLLLLTIAGCTNAEHKKNESAASTEKEISYYTCSMHPQIHKEEPGNCPICGMTLIPVFNDSPDSGLIIPPEKQKLIGMTKTTVERRKIENSTEQVEALTIPSSALVETGESWVFVVSGDRLEKRMIHTGRKNSDWIEITQGLSEGEIVASSATFLLDAESQLHGAAAETLTCPEGQTWDA